MGLRATWSVDTLRVFGGTSFVGLTFLLADLATLARSPSIAEVLGTAALQLGGGTALGATSALLVVPVRRRYASPFVLVVALIAFGVALRTALGYPRVSWGFATIAAFGYAALIVWALHPWAARPGGPRSVAPHLMAFGALVAVDRTVFVHQYRDVHLLLEIAASVHGAMAAAVWLARRPLRPISVLLVTSITAYGAIAVGLFFTSDLVLDSIDRSRLEENRRPTFSGRWSRRFRVARQRVFGASIWGAAPGLERLAFEHGLPDRGLDPRWNAPSVTVPGSEPGSPAHVVVFFVDALRADVAYDPRAMPRLAALREGGLTMRRTYAVGSSTVLSLVPTLGCRYDLSATTPPRLLNAARDDGRTSTLIAPRSARAFHGLYYPAFRFDEEIEADSAREGVRSALRRLYDAPEAPSFVWLYDYGVHEWASGQGPLADSSRYLAATRDADTALGELVDGLDALGLRERTLVVVLSDHGEALGERGLTTHATFLWESLLRVPWVMRGPGVPVGEIDTPVSLVDVTPTLSRFVRLKTTDCHGQDVLSSAHRRAHPILFSAVADGRLARVGTLGDPERKLVVDLDEGTAKLLRVDASSLREDDVSGERALLGDYLDQLVHSPLFPR